MTLSCAYVIYASPPYAVLPILLFQNIRLEERNKKEEEKTRTGHVDIRVAFTAIRLPLFFYFTTCTVHLLLFCTMNQQMHNYYVHVTVHRNKFLCNKTK